jgi:hypothetical protein
MMATQNDSGQPQAVPQGQPVGPVQYQPVTPGVQPVQPVQPVQYQPVVPVAPVPAPAPVPPQPQSEHEPSQTSRGKQEMIIYSHSTVFYWWPVWVVGFICAALTYFDPNAYEATIGGTTQLFHPSQGVGVSFTLTLFLVILITNATVRGLASAIVILVLVIFTLTAALFGWWDDILATVGNLHLYLNMRFYLVFSSLIFLLWAISVFVVDHMNYWRIRPGQMVHEFVLGASAKAYDTNNMVVQKFRDDLFRHWILGLGSGDLYVRPHGAQSEELMIPNVLFIGRKIATIQQMVAMDPDSFGSTTVS